MRRFVPLLILVLSVTLATAGDRYDTRRGGPVRVMTQNLYVGASLFRVLEAETPQEIPVFVAEVWATIEQTDFPQRAEALAEEIREHRPDLIGLQEVSRLTRLSPGNPPQVDLLDYLEDLQEALEDRGMHYEVAAVLENADLELPIATPTGLGLARMLDRDVILARRGVRTSDATTHTYQVALEFPIGSPPVAVAEFPRGFVAVDARVRGRTYRFVNTHLEIQGAALAPQVPFVQAAQAQELLAALSTETLPTIVVGDFNSSAEDAVAPPLFPPYAQFAASGYVDAWILRAGLPDPGYTCCQAELLTNRESVLGERVDLIWLRGGDGSPWTGLIEVATVGADPEDRTSGGMWISDHAGVAAEIRKPTGRPAFAAASRRGR